MSARRHAIGSNPESPSNADIVQSVEHWICNPDMTIRFCLSALMEEKMKLINITGDTVKMFDNEGLNVIAIYGTDGCATCKPEFKNIFEVEGIWVQEKSYQKNICLPEPKLNTLYIVSENVFNASERKDLITPNVESSVREFYSGEIRGFISFIGRK